MADNYNQSNSDMDTSSDVTTETMDNQDDSSDDTGVIFEPDDTSSSLIEDDSDQATMDTDNSASSI